jgi:hypothetical protein
VRCGAGNTHRAEGLTTLIYTTECESPAADRREAARNVEVGGATRGSDSDRVVVLVGTGGWKCGPAAGRAGDVVRCGVVERGRWCA